MEASGCEPFERSLNFSIKVADLWSAVQTAGMHINIPLPGQASKDREREYIRRAGVISLSGGIPNWSPALYFIH